MRNILSRSILVISLCLTIQVRAQQSYRSILLNGIKELPLPTKGRMVAATYISNNEPEIIGAINVAGLDIKLNVITAAQFGKGKIVLFGSSAYFNKPLLNDSSVVKLMTNILEERAANQKGKADIGWSGHMDASLSTVFSESYRFHAVHDFNHEKKTKIIFLDQDVKDSSQLQALENFVRQGGTLVFGSPIEEISKNNIANNTAGPIKLEINQLFKKVGLFNANVLIKTDENKLILNDFPFYLHPKTLFDQLALMDRDNVPYNIKAYVIDPSIDLIFAENKPGSPVFGAIKRIFNIADTIRFPSQNQPISIASAKEKWGYIFEEKFNRQQLGNEASFKAPGYQVFPGEVSAGAKRVNEKITIPVKVGKQGLFDPPSIFYRPQSTGFYVPAGEKVKITIGDELIAQHLKAQIGVHHDDLTHLDQLTRIGFDLTRNFELNKNEIEIFSPYGGLLTIKVADTSLIKTITLTVSGAVKSPYFKLGETKEEEWKTYIRDYPSPWAELATDNIILTVPSYRIRKLDHPVQLMQFWDEVMDADADLAVISRNRIHQERIIVDDEVAHGYMFTAPDRIIVPDDGSCEQMLNEEKMRAKGSWGHFHELGHRHQFWGIDFEGLGEVTVNLYSMYVYDQVLKKGIYSAENISSKDVVAARIKKYLDNDPTFAKWKSDPFTALCMYVQLIENFGWTPIKEVHAKYRAMPENRYPKTQQRKLDFWFVSICNATKSNLTRFFEIWKLPVSDQAKQEVSSYQKWLPSQFKSMDVEVKN